MLKALRENPARFAVDELVSATTTVQNIAYPSIDETHSTADILESIATAENSINSALRFLEMAKAKARKKSADRIIYRDVVERYVRRFGGETRFIVTDAPDDAKVILFDADGDARGEVSLFDRTFEIPDFDFSSLPY